MKHIIYRESSGAKQDNAIGIAEKQNRKLR